MFDTNKFLIQKWANGVSIAENKLENVHHLQLNDAAVALVVEKIFSKICIIFKMADCIPYKLFLKSLNIEMSLFHKTLGFVQGNIINMINILSLESRRAWVLWGLGGNKNFTA